MAGLPSIKQLIVEDFPSEKQWIGKLIEPLNRFMRTVYSLLDGNLNFGSNVRAQIKQVSFKNDASAFPMKFNNPFKVRPMGVVVLYIIEDAGNPAPFTNAVFPNWYLSQEGLIILTSLTGLTANSKYNMTLLVV